MIRALHDPNDILPFTLDWSAWLATFPTPMTITAVAVTAPPGITVVSSSRTDTTTTAVITGGEVGQEYPLLFRVTLSAGPPFQADQSLILVVRQR